MEKIKENLKRHMEELCLRIGTRHTGSAGEKLAADYLEKVFKEYGYETRREEYPTTGWEFESFELVNVTQQRAVPAAAPCFFSNAADIEGKLLWLTTADVKHLEDFPVQGRLCMVECWSAMNNVMGRNKIAEVLDSMGAAGAIFISNIHTSFAPSTKIQRSPFLKTLAACVVAQEGAYDIARHREDTYRLVIKARCFENISCNVIASRPGKTGATGVFGAHYDTAPLTQGAGDNASGTAIVLELARLLKDEPTEMKIEFAQFSAEEYIPEFLPPGSEDYVKRHGNEDIKWLINFDDFGILIGEPYIKVNLMEKLPPFTSKRFEVRKAVSQDGDDKSFFHAGIPTIWYFDSNPFYTLHTEKDSLDTIDYDKMTAAVIDSVDVFRQIGGAK